MSATTWAMGAPDGQRHRGLEHALVEIGRHLKAGGYRFVTPAPATHARVNAREPAAKASSVRDIFGWSRPFLAEALDANLLEALSSGGLVEEVGAGLLRSRARFSSIGEDLFAHSAYPTTQADAIFFGPDTYRFAALIRRHLRDHPLRPRARIADIGCGSGAGGIVAARAAAAASPQLLLADINPMALRHAAANAELAGLQGVALGQGDLYAAAPGEFDLVIANPPYLNDSARRTYRHGGGEWGGGLSERIVREGAAALAPGGWLLLYTGTAIVEGTDPLYDALRPGLQALGWTWSWEELDPDVFGEELDEPAYRRADRIAVVALALQRPAA